MKKCIIIGGGPAGLTAGYELLSKSKDYEVVILEASDTLGGISRTVKYNGNRMDIGGHRFFSKDKNVTAFWEKIMRPHLTIRFSAGRKTLLQAVPTPKQKTGLCLSAAEFQEFII